MFQYCANRDAAVKVPQDGDICHFKHGDALLGIHDCSSASTVRLTFQYCANRDAAAKVPRMVMPAVTSNMATHCHRSGKGPTPRANCRTSTSGPEVTPPAFFTRMSTSGSPFLNRMSTMSTSGPEVTPPAFFTRMSTSGSLFLNEMSTMSTSGPEDTLPAPSR
eukprot:1160727-Pelagomonas_calceolata.AAC.18